jgi:hypothetical protein
MIHFASFFKNLLILNRSVAVAVRAGAVEPELTVQYTVGAGHWYIGYVAAPAPCRYTCVNYQFQNEIKTSTGICKDMIPRCRHTLHEQ